MPDRPAHLDAARLGMSALVSGLRESRRYETLPRYRENQPRFLNAVLVGTTTAGPREVLDLIRRLETREGRDRGASGRMGPRPLDIDILLAGDRVIDEPDLRVPHPLMYERKFVLLPLLDLLPDAVDPVSGRKFRDFFTKLPDQGIYYYSLCEFACVWT